MNFNTFLLLLVLGCLNGWVCFVAILLVLLAGIVEITKDYRGNLRIRK